jgi:hypothetical protein
MSEVMSERSPDQIREQIRELLDSLYRADSGRMASQGPSKCTAGRLLISRHRMLLEEIPDDNARVKVAAKVAPARSQRLITAWPVVAATLDRVQRDIRAILAVTVAFDASARAIGGVDVWQACHHRSQRATVPPDPILNVAFELATVERNYRVGGPMHYKKRNGPTRRFGAAPHEELGETAGDRSDGGDLVRPLARESIGHGRAFR